MCNGWGLSVLLYTMYYTTSSALVGHLLSSFGRVLGFKFRGPHVGVNCLLLHFLSLPLHIMDGICNLIAHRVNFYNFVGQNPPPPLICFRSFIDVNI